MECHCSCWVHIPPVQRVHVWDGSYDWGIFEYCQSGIQEDESRGLQVVIEEGE